MRIAPSTAVQPAHHRLHRRRARAAAAALAAAATAVLVVSVPSQPVHAKSKGMTATALTLQQQAGQRIIYSYPGLTPPDTLLQHIRNGEAAGVIFFGENISSTTQIASVVQQLRAAQAQSPVQSPLLLMTDQEGGLVRRLPGEPVLSEKQIGQAADPPTEATNAGTGAGKNLRSVGMNVNLAPVLDVYYQAGNFIDQYQRSYSNNASVVGPLGRNFITAQQAQGVAATAKHFPGLGSATTNQNTDSGPVTLNITETQLRTIDEAPYSAAFAAGVKLVMLSWAKYPALDAGLPAGLSSWVVQRELRGRLAYQGVTMTDALEAGALSSYGSTGNRALLAAQAGVDLILCSARDVTQGEAATTALANALSDGRLDQPRFQASLDRITALRNSLP